VSTLCGVVDNSAKAAKAARRGVLDSAAISAAFAVRFGAVVSAAFSAQNFAQIFAAISARVSRSAFGPSKRLVPRARARISPLYIYFICIFLPIV